MSSSSTPGWLHGSIPVCKCCCDCYEGRGGGGGTIAGGVVDAFDGGVSLSSHGLEAKPFNVPIGSELSYSSVGVGAYNGPSFGPGWQSHSLAGLTFASGSDEVDYQLGPSQREVFLPTGIPDQWAGAYFVRSRLVKVTRGADVVYIMTLQDGTRREFDESGRLILMQGAGGQSFSVSHAADAITVQHPATGTAVVKLTFAIQSGKVVSATQELNGQAFRRTLYSYHDASSGGQLKKVIDEEFRPGFEWQIARRTWYSYKNAGYGLLEFVFQDDTLRRMESAGQDPDTVSAPGDWADNAFSYDHLSRVASASSHGGQYSWSVDYSASGFNGDSWNDWTNKTVVTRPDGSVETVYFNRAGSVLLRKIQSGSDVWYPLCQRFDEKLRVHEVISAAAIDVVDEALPELFTLKSSSGMIRRLTYGVDSGLLDEERVVEGSAMVSSALLRKRWYVPRSLADQPTIWLPSKEEVYRTAAGTEPSTTEWVYEWHVDSYQMAKRTTKLPVVSALENGTGQQFEVVEVFDVDGFMTARTDESGMKTAFTPHPETGGVTRMVVDEGAGRLSLTTDYELDDEGRVILEKGPVHSIDLNGVETAIRRAVWTFYKDAERERVSFPGYIVEATGVQVCVGPISIMRHAVAPAGQGNGSSYDDTITATWELVRLPLIDEVYPRATWTSWRRREMDSKGVHVADVVYHAIPGSGDGVVDTNFARTAYGYDALGRRNLEVTPGGTRLQSVFNAMGWETSRLVGTAEGNMVTTATMVYDNGAAGGDGLLTQSTVLVDGAGASTDRVTSYTYDWRQRRRTSAITTAIEGATVTLITQNAYDNRDLVTEIQEYRNAAGQAVNLLSQTRMSFDALGREYRRMLYRVEPGQSADPSSFLYDDTWFDPVGRVLARRPAGSELFRLMAYDAAGRTTGIYDGYDAGGSSSSGGGANSAPTLGGSVIMSQQVFTNDAAGNVTLVVQRDRFDDATGNGALRDGGTTQPRARVTYTAAYPDALGRVVASATSGTNGNAVWTRPPTIPTGTDNLLVTRTLFNPAGEAWQMIDPMGAVTTRTWDAASRLVREVLGRVPGRNMPIIDRITEFRYNADGNMTRLIAENNGGERQETIWTYGVNTGSTGAGSGSALNSNLLVATKTFPDSNGGSDVVSFTWNRAGQMTTMRDQTGLVHTYGYDKLGRQVSDEVTSWGASAADQTIRRLTRGFDARGLVVSASSFGTGTAAVNAVTFEYNGWRQVTVETQSAGGASRSVRYSYASGTANTIRRTAMTFPSGSNPSAGPALVYAYTGAQANALSRPASIQAVESSVTTSLINYRYLGLAAPVEVEYAVPQTRMSFGTSADQYAALDRFGRPVDVHWRRGPGATTVVRAQYGYDRSSNRQWRRDARARTATPPVTTEDQWYEYDGLYEVRGFQRGTLTGTLPHFSGVQPVSQNQAWDFDAMGNWLGFTSGALQQTRQFNKVNETTNITGPSGVITPQYDATGCMTAMPAVDDWTSARTLTWDAWQRPVRVQQGATVVAEYAYDALFRRIAKTIAGTTRRFCYNDQWQIVEEYVGTASTPAVRYWHGLRDINDIARRQRYSSGTTLQDDIYALRDTMNVVALISAAGTVPQRMAYDAFGNVRFLTAEFTAGTNEADWAFLFHGHFRDAETGLYQMRFRSYHPNLGVWLSRDPIGEVGGANLYGMVGNSVTRFWDLDGREKIDPIIVNDVVVTDADEPPYGDPHYPGQPRQPEPHDLQDLAVIAARKATARCECCIEHLVIRTHGTPFNWNLANSTRGSDIYPAEGVDIGKVGVARPRALDMRLVGDYMKNALKKLGTPFCRKCTVWVQSGNSFAFMETKDAGEEVGKTLARSLGCSVKAIKGYCQTNIPRDPLKAAHWRAGVPNGPVMREFPGSVDGIGQYDSYDP